MTTTQIFLPRACYSISVLTIENHSMGSLRGGLIGFCGQQSCQHFNAGSMRAYMSQQTLLYAQYDLPVQAMQLNGMIPIGNVTMHII